MSRTESAHARYRTQLLALADEDVVPGAVAEAGRRWGWPEEAAWARTHERFDPDEEPYATCVLTGVSSPQRLVRVEAFAAEQSRADADAFLAPAGAAGRLRVTGSLSDPALPALATVRGGPGRRTVVRYRPGRRCTIRVEDDGRIRFAKIFPDGEGAAAHAAGLEVWRAACRGELEFGVARPAVLEPGGRVVWQEGVEGEPLRERLYGEGGDELAGRVGRAAASLARSRLRPLARRDAATELARSARRCAELVHRVPGLREDAHRLLRGLEALHAAAGTTQLRPVHGALHASQWLVDGSQLALLDYDRVALGDPELDAATFLADVDVQNRERVPVERLNAAFLAGYGEAGRLDPALLAAYRAHRRLEKALRVARAIRPDGDRKAARRLRRALECLGGAA
jgi:hypothetical protein